MFKITIPFAPKSLDRVRFSNSRRAYTKAETKQAKLTTRLYMQKQYKESPSEASLAVVLIFVHKRPKALKVLGRTAKRTKPDIDNLTKLYFDAANGLLWKDDNQISTLCCFDYYAAVDEEPHVEIYFNKISNENQADFHNSILNYFVDKLVDN
jgi:Holliday junction resolvase RusA-like endonuclease